MKPRRRPLIIGVDGEGHDLPDGTHVYTYLAAVDEHGETRGETRFAPGGLSHDECAELLLSIRPRAALKFGFMFTYDLTKILQELPFNVLYELWRPELRTRHVCKTCKRTWGFLEPSEHAECDSPDVQGLLMPARWNGRAYSYRYGPFTISDRPAGRKTRRSTTVWDAFKFFQSSFARALRLWGLDRAADHPKECTCAECERAELEVRRIEGMKAKRGRKDFGSPAAIMAYCKSECRLLARLMRLLLETCGENGIEPTDYFGAGSIASALLREHEVKRYLGPSLDQLDRRHAGLSLAIRSAYAGGRSEVSTVGAVPGAVYSADVSSAYPAALVELPCLKCGTWRHVRGSHEKVVRAARGASLALYRFAVRSANAAERRRMAWAPLPFRDARGSIAYPTGFAGWAWGQEAIPAAEGWPELVTFSEAWTYATRCKHRPFAFLADLYRRRVALGSSARGIVLKLGYNAVYGKTAQHTGKAPFRSWVWAGACTATTRGQLLRAIKRARSPWDVLAVATDGIVSRRDLRPEALGENGTSDLARPLGAWEVSRARGGIFIAKPGVYWPLDAKKSEADRFRARGLGRREVAIEHERLERAFARWDRTHARAPTVRVAARRFYAARTSVLSRYVCGGCKQGFPGRPQQGCQTPDCPRFRTVPTVLIHRGEVLSPRTALLHVPPCAACRRKDARGVTRGRRRCGCDGCRRSPERERHFTYCGRCNRPALGQWAMREQLVTFDAMPKRERDTLSAGRTYARMRVRDVSAAGVLAASRPYMEGETSPEGLAAREDELERLEQEDDSD